MSSHLTWHNLAITTEDRQKRNGHQSVVVWLTGLSGSGKSTIANAVERKLFQEQYQSYLLDGDNIRHGLNKDLGFTEIDRKENIRRIGEVAKLFVDSGSITITAFISPFREERDYVRKMLQEGQFIEVYVKCPLDVCEKRDPKGLYAKARKGIIPNFTGISSPYEAPVDPELIIETDQQSIEKSANEIIHYIKNDKRL